VPGVSPNGQPQQSDADRPAHTRSRVRTFASGGKVTKFGFAVNNNKKNQQTGQWEDVPVFLDCEAFNRGENTLADRIETTLRKGQQIYIDGHLRFDQWDDKTTGAKRSALKIVVDNFQYLERREDGGSGGGSYQQRPAAAPRRPSGPPDEYDSGPEHEMDAPMPNREPAPEGDIPF